MIVTEKAIEQFKNEIKRYDNPETGIRLFASSGCCGPAIQMDVVDHLSYGDTLVNINDVNFFIQQKVESMLSDIIIDFRDDSFKLDGLKKSGSCCG